MDTFEVQRKEIRVPAGNKGPFQERMKDLFDMAHQDATKIIQIQQHRDFLNAQKQEGRKGSMIVLIRF